MDFIYIQDHIYLIYQNKKHMWLIVIRFENSDKQRYEFNVDLNKLLDYHAYQQSFKILGLRIQSVHNSSGSMQLDFLVVFQEFQSYLISVQYIYENGEHHSTILGCFNRFDSDFVVNQFETRNKQLSIISYFNNRLILSVYDIDYC